MLVEFRFGNFSSFKDEAVLSMIAAPQLDGDVELDKKNVFAVPGHANLRLLRTAGVYGANASGKSNVFKAVHTCEESVASSTDSKFFFPVVPFAFDNSSRNNRTFFEIVFILEAQQYRYGFELTHQGNSPRISEEWLYHANSQTEEVLFERKGNTVEIKDAFQEGKLLIKPNNTIIRPEALFLSLCNLFNDEASISSKVSAYISANLNVISGTEDNNLYPFTLDCFKSGMYRDEISNLLCKADTGISGIETMDREDLRVTINNMNGSQIPSESEGANELLDKLALFSEHPVFDANGHITHTRKVPMRLFESAGTLKLFAIAGPVIDTLKAGKVLFVDEMDAKFHPLMTKELIRLFQSEKTNPHNAQLIFVTHDTNLLSKELFRRDQIWFVEKDSYGGSHLYSLAEFKFEETKDSPYKEDYIAGRYGAIPFLGDFSNLFKTWEQGDISK